MSKKEVGETKRVKVKTLFNDVTVVISSGKNISEILKDLVLGFFGFLVFAFGSLLIVFISTGGLNASSALIFTFPLFGFSLIAVKAFFDIFQVTEIYLNKEYFRVSHKILCVCFFRASFSTSEILKIVATTPVDRRSILWSKPKLVEPPFMSIYCRSRKIDFRNKFVDFSDVYFLSEFLYERLKISIEFR